MHRRILTTLDGSALAEQAIATALTLAEMSEADLERWNAYSLSLY